MSEGRMTVIICARDAERYVGRAVSSAVRAKADRVLLVDDYSADGTVEMALAEGAGKVEVVRPSEKRGLGNARQAGIESVDTEYAMWLDADDALLPGRVESFKEALDAGNDFVFDSAELFDGETGKLMRILEMPSYMNGAGSAVRLFERNYLPGPAWPGVRVESARKVGYDVYLPTGEDLDFNLRAYTMGGKFAFLESVGYRQFGYASSLSRNRSLQLGAVARVLSKFQYGEVVDAYQKEGYGKCLGEWAAVSMATFREDWKAVKEYSDRAFSGRKGVGDVLDPQGPLPLPDSWRCAFANGVANLMENNRESEGFFREAERIHATAEGANNLGVALYREDDQEGATKMFLRAIERSPGYFDAMRNWETNGRAQEITRHPLRLQSSRDDYSD